MHKRPYAPTWFAASCIQDFSYDGQDRGIHREPRVLRQPHQPSQTVDEQGRHGEFTGIFLPFDRSIQVKDEYTVSFLPRHLPENGNALFDVTVTRIYSTYREILTLPKKAALHTLAKRVWYAGLRRGRINPRLFLEKCSAAAKSLRVPLQFIEKFLSQRFVEAVECVAEIAKRTPAAAGKRTVCLFELRFAVIQHRPFVHVGKKGPGLGGTHRIIVAVTGLGVHFECGEDLLHCPTGFLAGQMLESPVSEKRGQRHGDERNSQDSQSNPTGKSWNTILIAGAADHLPCSAFFMFSSS